MKDASAAAIYGAKAAGGVILVTTKRGTKSKIKIGISSSYGVRTVDKLFDQMSRDEYLNAKRLYGVDVVATYGPEATGAACQTQTGWMNSSEQVQSRTMV